MVLMWSDVWYVALTKLFVLFLATYILVKVLKDSLWNFGQRIVILRVRLTNKELPKLTVGVFAALFNFLFLWVVLQAITMLALGYVGCSPKMLSSNCFHEITFVAALYLVLRVVLFNSEKGMLSGA